MKSAEYECKTIKVTNQDYSCRSISTLGQRCILKIITLVRVLVCCFFGQGGRNCSGDEVRTSGDRMERGGDPERF